MAKFNFKYENIAPDGYPDVVRVGRQRYVREQTPEAAQTNVMAAVLIDDNGNATVDIGGRRIAAPIIEVRGGETIEDALRRTAEFIDNAPPPAAPDSIDGGS